MKSLITLILIHISILPNSSFAETVRFVGANPALEVKVELADTQSKAERGLMFRKDMPEGTGMWFIFGDDAERVFWMKNVIFPLDMIFIDKSFVIRKIEKMAPPCVHDPCPRYYSGGPARYVLEVPGGYCGRKGVREGQKVEYTR